MSETYFTKQGQTVDMVCNNHYGKTKDITELVFKTNHGLADLGQILPIGTKIILPVVEDTTSDVQLVQLWGSA